MRVAFSGASGTGKTTLAKYVAEKYGLPMNPIGSRTVAEQMGFASPYDVDAAGRRGEFQQRLMEEKIAWESEHDAWVSDRTTADNLAYAILHGGSEWVVGIDYGKSKQGIDRVTHLFILSVKDFCKLGDDAARRRDLGYQRVYETVLLGVYEELTDGAWKTRARRLRSNDLADRKRAVAYELAALPLF